MVTVALLERDFLSHCTLAPRTKRATVIKAIASRNEQRDLLMKPL